MIGTLWYEYSSQCAHANYHPLPIQQLTFILCVSALPEEGPGAEVYELDLVSLEINEDVFILYVPVHHAHRLAVLYCLQDLPEQVAGRALTHHALLRDVIEQVDVLLGPLHDDVEVVGVLKVVQHLDDKLVVQAMQEGHLAGDHILPNLGERERGRGRGRERGRGGGGGGGGGGEGEGEGEGKRRGRGREEKRNS